MESEEGTKEQTPEARKDQLKQELAGERKRSEELLTRLKYMQADLENERKRMDKVMQEASDAHVKALVSKLLVVLDELDLAVKHASAGNGDPELKEGFEMVERKLESALASVGLEKIECVGRPFDPALHEAVEKAQGDSGEDTVVEEVRPGFRFRGQLLRPSMVKVELARVEAKQEEKTVE
jgi:molecular chaperone GrpE